MKYAVMHFTKCSGKTTLASAKIAKYLAQRLNAPLVDCLERGIGLHPEILFVVNSPWAFCDFRDQVHNIRPFVKKLIWIQNDYAIDIPKEFRDYDSIWSTCPKESDGKCLYVNWNQLTFRPVTHVGGMGLIYYGAYRKDREEAFRRYFRPLGNSLAISASAKAMPSFEKLAPMCRRAGTMEDVYYSLAKFDSTLYIQDKKSGEQFHSPANRFYEAISAGLAIFFDEQAVGTLRTAGYDVTPYVVKDGVDLKRRLPESKAVAEAQRPWREIPHLERLEIQLQEALQTL